MLASGLVCAAVGHESPRPDVVEPEPYVEDSAWEPEDVPTTPVWMARHETRPVGLFSALMLRGIRGYQEGSGRRSVSRCPFAISCSRFAVRAIRRHGPVLGLLLFIDRHLYRENPATPYMYPLTEMKNRTLKLNDAYFLYGHWHPPSPGE